MADFPVLDLTYPQNQDTPVLVELLYACLDDFEPASIVDHERGDGWRVFFRTAASRDAALQALRTRFGGRLASLAGADVVDEGWARRSQAQLTAVRVGRIVVTPPWAPEAAPDQRETGSPGDLHDVVIVIEPSMGFGTGHHATTRLCLQLLQREPVEGRRVTDVGTGSGVLALAAWKLGAAAVTAVDCDPDALQNARENVHRNGADAGVGLVESDLSTLDLEPAAVVLANLTGAVLQRYASALLGLTTPGGRIIVSGFAPDERAGIERALGLPSVESAVEGAWSAVVFGVPAGVTTPPTQT